ncbi:MAG: hypothetical protein ACOH1P_08155 [Lysobacter sp.]
MSSYKRAIYAPDTNFFIQCKDPDEIDWSLVSEADTVVLVVLNEVHREIDRLKSGGNARRAKRARAISSQLRGLVVSGKGETEMRGSGPAVFLRLAPRLDPARERPNGFDPTSADERIAEEAKACSDSFFNGELALLSHDGMPLRAAHLLGMQICAVPDEWLLPPEPSDQDRTIQKLNERVAALERQAPSIELRLEDDSQTSIAGEMIFYPPISGDFVARVMDALTAAFPIQRPSTGKATSSIENIIRGFDPVPTEADLRAHEAKYQEWVEKVEDFIGRLPRIHSLMADAVEAILVMSNNGSTPAEHLVIDAFSMGQIRLQEPVDDEDEIEIPEIPQPPKLRRINMFASMSDFGAGPLVRDPLRGMRFPTNRIARDRHEFYWDFDKPRRNSEHCRGECEDFRHGLKDERIHLLLKWDEPKEGAIAGALRVVVSARNMPLSIEKIIPVRLDVEVGDSEALIRSIVQQELGVTV